MMKKLLFILMLFVSFFSMAQPTVQASLNCAIRSNLRSNIGGQNQVCSVYGVSSFGDLGVIEVYRFDFGSTATDNNLDVFKPTLLETSEGGRWIKYYTVSMSTNAPIPVISTSSRATNTAWQNNTARPVMGFYSITASVTNPLLAGSSTVQIFGEVSENGTTGWTTYTQNGNSSSVALAVAIAITNGQTGNLVFVVPPGKYGRIRVVTTGTASASIPYQWEMNL